MAAQLPPRLSDRRLACAGLVQRAALSAGGCAVVEGSVEDGEAEGEVVTWFLVMIATGSYLGPLTEQACKQAGFVLNGEGVVCREAVFFTACDVAGRPGTSTTCPVFEFPRIIVKP